MDNDNMLKTAKAVTVAYYKDTLNQEIDFSDVYIVWFCKTLQNWKALTSTNIPDHRYFELTYNGDKKELYFDSYVKENNIAMSVEDRK